MIPPKKSFPFRVSGFPFYTRNRHLLAKAANAIPPYQTKITLLAKLMLIDFVSFQRETRNWKRFWEWRLLHFKAWITNQMLSIPIWID
jgi:hypothetical protein